MTSATIDPRGARFAAAITAALLAVSLILGPSSITAAVALAVQTIAFALGALLGPATQPWSVIFARWIRPRLGAPAQLEDARPPRFAQAVGLVFALLGLTGLVAGIAPLYFTALGFAVIAAVLNAAFDLCLGCELYLLAARLRRRFGQAQ